MAAESLNWNLDKFEQRYRLTMHDERSAEIHQAFLTLGCVLICWNTRTCPVLIGAIPRRACARTTKRTWRDQANVPHSIEWSSQVALPVGYSVGCPGDRLGEHDQGAPKLSHRLHRGNSQLRQGLRDRFVKGDVGAELPGARQ
jgi:hypothetical protein